MVSVVDKMAVLQPIGQEFDSNIAENYINKRENTVDYIISQPHALQGLINNNLNRVTGIFPEIQVTVTANYIID